jgi:hypothetical protein
LIWITDQSLFFGWSQTTFGFVQIGWGNLPLVLV